MVIFHSYVNVYQIARKCLVFPVDLFILGVQSWEVKPWDWIRTAHTISVKHICLISIHLDGSTCSIQNPEKKTHHHRFCCQNNYLLWRRHGPRHAILPGRIAWWQLGGWDAEGTGLWSQSREAADGDAPLGAWKTRGKHRGKHVAAMAVKPVTWAAAFIWLNDVKWRIVLYSLVAYPGLSKTS